MLVARCWPPARPAHSETPPLVQKRRIKIDYQEPRHPIYGYVIDPDDARMAKGFQERRGYKSSPGSGSG